MPFSGSLRLSPVKPALATRIGEVATQESLTVQGASDVQAGGGGQSGPSNGNNVHINRLTKLFPVEGVTFYPLILGVAADSQIWKTGGLLVLAGLIFLVRLWGTKPVGGGSPLWKAAAVSSVAFIIYAFALGGFGWMFGEEANARHYTAGALVSGVFTWLLGTFAFALPVDET